MTLPTRPHIKPAAGWRTDGTRPHTWSRGPYRIAQMWHPDRLRWVLRAYRGDLFALDQFHLVGDFEAFDAAVEGCVEDWSKRERRP